MPKTDVNNILFKVGCPRSILGMLIYDFIFIWDKADQLAYPIRNIVV